MTRLKGVWGADADVFKPTRHLDDNGDKQVKVGIYGNLSVPYLLFSQHRLKDVSLRSMSFGV